NLAFTLSAPVRRPRRQPLFPYTTLFRSARTSTRRRAMRYRAAPTKHSVTCETRPALDRRRRPAARDRADRRRDRATAQAHPTSVDRKSTRLNSSHDQTSYAVFRLKKKKT